MRQAGRHVERLLGRLGYRAVIGVDEVGMGPLAGPVVAAAVMLPRRATIPAVADSKTLTARMREKLARRIRRVAVAVGVGRVEPEEIDRMNIHRAGLEAMRRALQAMGDAEGAFLVVDGREIPSVPLAQCAFPGADGFVASVAAASIVAKVERDGMMTCLHESYPRYGFDSHKGYGTPAHLNALATYGPSPVHRRSFAPVALAASGAVQEKAPGW